MLYSNGSTAKTKKGTPSATSDLVCETGPEVFASQKLQGVFPTLSPGRIITMFS